jgi:23S rRNA G2069 N7-methylase RlmK/C1962 C5-methylase RlmI
MTITRTYAQHIFPLFQHIREIYLDFFQTCEEAYHSYHNGAVNTSCSKDEELYVDHQQPEKDMSILTNQMSYLHRK